MTKQYTSPRYEYTTREFPPGYRGYPDYLKAEGYSQAWARLTGDGIYVVYMREKKP